MVRRQKQPKKEEEERYENNKKCSGIVSHILYILGAYFISKGILSASGKLSGFSDVLSSAIFWGIILVMGGVCASSGIKKDCCCN